MTPTRRKPLYRDDFTNWECGHITQGQEKHDVAACRADTVERARRALTAVLGGRSAAAKRERRTAMTPAEMREYLMTAPDPLDGPPIFDREGGEDGYDLSARCTAKAMLLCAEADPTLLTVPSKEEDPTGIDRAFSDKLWQAAKDRWPGLDNWLGGITGFQFGWANNAVRYVLGTEPVGNPAIVTIG